jgi:membrane-associated protein
MLRTSSPRVAAAASAVHLQAVITPSAPRVALRTVSRTVALPLRALAAARPARAAAAAATASAGAAAPPPPRAPARALLLAAAAALLFFAAAPAALAAAAAAAPQPSAGSALAAALDVFLHLDAHLGAVIARYGAATYAILFAIVFAETGLVVAPFLPGDSLLFATGALAALGRLDLGALAATYVVAATLGDAVNYAVGAALGGSALAARLVRPAHLERTRAFYAQHGGKAVVLARFIPIVRTFAPFVAGVGRMAYGAFAAYNVAGALLWTGVCLGAG